MNSELLTNIFEYIHREECDLSVVILAIIEKAISSNAASGHAFNERHLQVLADARLLSMVSEIVVPLRNVQVADRYLHIRASVDQIR